MRGANWNRTETLACSTSRRGLKQRAQKLADLLIHFRGNVLRVIPLVIVELHVVCVVKVLGRHPLLCDYTHPVEQRELSLALGREQLLNDVEPEARGLEGRRRWCCNGGALEIERLEHAQERNVLQLHGRNKTVTRCATME
jgi:hypothetical protein